MSEKLEGDRECWAPNVGVTGIKVWLCICRSSGPVQNIQNTNVEKKNFFGNGRIRKNKKENSNETTNTRRRTERKRKMSCYGSFGGGFGGLSAGVTSGGTLAQLIALGASDTHLTMLPSVTFWRLRVCKCTNFAMESIIQTFTGTVAWGSEVQITLNRTGDLIYWMYILIDIPGIRAVEDCHGSSRDRGVAGFTFPYARTCDPCGDERSEFSFRRDRDRDRSDRSDRSDRDHSDHSNRYDSRDSRDRDGSSRDRSDRSDRSDRDGSCCGSSEHSSESDASWDECGLKGPWAHWVDEIGFAALPRVAYSIGGQVIDTVHSDYMHMWEELSGQPGKRLEEMIGKGFSTAELVRMSHRARRLYVPIPFSFTRHSGNALPLVSLQFHTLQVHVHFACLQSLIKVSDCDVRVIKCHDNQPIGNNDMCAYLDTTYVYLDMEERDRFAVGSFQQLITQVQGFCTTGHVSEQITAQLNFNHPSLELIWAVQRQCQRAANNTFNYSGAFCEDPIRRARLMVNNLARFDREAPYFRMVQPYQAHTNIPRGFIYDYSFALDPESPQPSGSLNFSRIDNVEFSVRLQEAIAATGVNLLIFCRNFNILRFKEGLGGLLYS